MCSAELREKGIKLSISNEIMGREIMVDNQLLGQVLINLIKNAKEALIGSKNGEVILEAKLNTSKVEISVSDNGPGIDPDILDKIFVPFFTTKESGSGIGLALSRQIMHAHNGRLEVESSTNGTIFSLMF